MNNFEQGLLKYLTKAQLSTIQSKRIGIGGAGGLGSNIAITLCRCGFNNFEILDKDIVEASNLNRQQFSLDDIGKVKVDALKEALLAINSDVSVITHNESWSEKNASKFFSKCDYIIEAFDNAEYKKKFIEYYEDKSDTIISGNGMVGISEEDNIKIKKIGKVFVVGDQTSDIEKGLPPMAPRVIICAAKMANIVLSETLSGTKHSST